MKIGVIVDRMTVPRWSLDALSRLPGSDEIIIYNCVNSPSSRKRLKNSAYYALNLVTVRNRYTRGVPLDALTNVSAKFDFEAEQDGIWQRLPQSLLDRVAADAPAVLVKFGLGLLRIPERRVLSPPILSYHHGDPEQFRGRPAGFYELLNGAPVMGQIVQILSNKLDAGAVVASAETRVHRHSYRATLMEAYRHSPLLLETAIRNATAGVTVPKSASGKLYRLPGNLTVFDFCLKAARATASRLVGGLFLEKAWRVSTAPADPARMANEAAVALPPKSGWNTPDLPEGYAFLADPFFHPGASGLLVEGLRRATNHGEILHIDGTDVARLSAPTGHQSYPACVTEGGSHYLIPEMADCSTQRIYRLEGAGLEEVGELRMAGGAELLDPTLYRLGEDLFLFANLADEGDSVLRLWHSKSLFEEFTEHPASPVLISPAGARMAGALHQAGPRLLRFGQDFTRRYGDGIIIFEIQELSPSGYREKQIGEYRFGEVRGPHTLNFKDGVAAFDWYENRFSLLAAPRRLRRAKPRTS